MSLVKVVYDKESEWLVREALGLESESLKSGNQSEKGKVWGYIKEEGKVRELSSVSDFLDIVDKV